MLGYHQQSPLGAGGGPSKGSVYADVRCEFLGPRGCRSRDPASIHPFHSSPGRQTLCVPLTVFLWTAGLSLIHLLEILIYFRDRAAFSPKIAAFGLSPPAPAGWPVTSKQDVGSPGGSLHFLPLEPRAPMWE